MPDQNELFGELRSLSHEPSPTAHTWKRVCHNLNMWSDEAVSEIALPYLTRHLDVWPDRIKVTPELWLERLLAHGREPRLALCRVLAISSRHQDRLDMERLLHDEALCVMRGLDLSGCVLRPGLLNALVHGTAFDRIRTLDLQAMRGVNFPGMERLIESPWLEGLEVLNLADTSLRDDGFEVFVSAPALASLRELSCADTFLTGAAIERIPHAVWAPHIESLDLGGCEVADSRSLSRMLAHEPMHRLEALNLRGVGISQQVIAAWREHEHFTHLESLCVSEHTNLGTSALAQLCTAPWAQHLKRLELGEMGLDDMRLQVVLTSLGQAAVRQLVLEGNRITDLGAKFLEQALLFARLDFLDVAYNALTRHGIQTLEQSPRGKEGLQVKWWQD